VSPDLEYKWVGRVFSGDEFRLVQQIVAEYPALSVHELSLTICELLNWKRPNGGLKAHECRAWLQQLRTAGCLVLPALQRCGPKGPQRIAAVAVTALENELRGSVGALGPLRLDVVEAGSPDSARFRTWITQHHYLGYRVPVGASLRYLVRSVSGQVLACLLWSSPAWKMAPRDDWIGWSTTQREQNLQYIVQNSRFLILPWVRVSCLASKILSRCAGQLPKDWQQRYGYRPLLLETLVDGARFAGTSYRAANWIGLGQTTGRGRMDRQREAVVRPKDIYVYPLCRHVHHRLHSSQAPQISAELRRSQSGKD
jgi:Domain of unknown function (DUF4338)